MKTSKLAVLPAILALALVGVGCGGGEDSPEDVVDSFYSALSDGDAGEICGLLSDSAAEGAAEGEDSCEAGVQKGIDSGEAEEALGVADQVEIGEAKVDGDNATVTVTHEGEEAEVPLVKEDGEWKIDIG